MFRIIVEAKGVVALFKLKMAVPFALEVRQLVSEFELLAGRMHVGELIMIVHVALPIELLQVGRG